MISQTVPLPAQEDEDRDSILQSSWSRMVPDRSLPRITILPDRDDLAVGGPHSLIPVPESFPCRIPFRLSGSLGEVVIRQFPESGKVPLACLPGFPTVGYREEEEDDGATPRGLSLRQDQQCPATCKGNDEHKRVLGWLIAVPPSVDEVGDSRSFRHPPANPSRDGQAGNGIGLRLRREVLRPEDIPRGPAHRGPCTIRHFRLPDPEYLPPWPPTRPKGAGGSLGHALQNDGGPHRHVVHPAVPLRPCRVRSRTMLRTGSARERRSWFVRVPPDGIFSLDTSPEADMTDPQAHRSDARFASNETIMKTPWTEMRSRR